MASFRLCAYIWQAVTPQLAPSVVPPLRARALPAVQCRYASDQSPQRRNSLLEAYEKQRKADRKSSAALQQPNAKHGSLSKESIFAEEEDESATPADSLIVRGQSRDLEAIRNALDPDPRSRRRWERAMVIREIRRNGRLSKTEAIAQSERQSLTKSPMIETSTKKLGMLARQIAGKTVDDALIQLRFSKKKSAVKVKEFLEYAKNEAIVKRGMGLGVADGTTGTPTQIQLKNGKRHRITDQTNMYIEQAWVGRGEYGHSMEYRARGRQHLLDHPQTSTFDIRSPAPH